jgi:hypothetical protein
MLPTSAIYCSTASHGMCQLGRSVGCWSATGAPGSCPPISLTNAFHFTREDGGEPAPPSFRFAARLPWHGYWTRVLRESGARIAWTASIRTHPVRGRSSSGTPTLRSTVGLGETKPDVVVAIRRVVPVAVRHPKPRGIIVPRAAADHAPGALASVPRRKTTPSKIAAAREAASP